MQVAFCATVGMIGNPELDYMSWAMNWGLAYDLPNKTWIIEHRHEKFPKPLVQRRYVSLYNNEFFFVFRLVGNQRLHHFS